MNTPIPDIYFDELFGAVAPSYQWAPSIRYLLRRDRVLRIVESFSPGSLLEIGCGAGTLFADFERRGFRCVGIETSSRALDLAGKIGRQLHPNSLFFSALCAVEPGPKHRIFDVVCAFDVLEHIYDDAAALSEWCEWMAPGGYLLLSVPAHQSRWGSGDVWAGHYKRYDRSDLLSLVECAGLRIEHIECYGFPLANITEALGERAYRRLLRQRDMSSGRNEATAESGVERRSYTRLFGMMSSPLGRLMMRGAFAIQQVFAKRTDWGSGYLIVCRHQ